MLNEPLVSIGILCFNQAEYLVETLNSIHNQSYKNIEILIVDDCSSDNSLEVAKEWIDKNNVTCKIYEHVHNKGVTYSSNELLFNSKGKYFSLIASDDIMYENKIENQVKALEQVDEKFAFLYSDALIIDEKGFSQGEYFIEKCKGGNFSPPSGFIFNELLLNNFIPIMSCLFKVKYLKDIGGFDENLSYEDYDLLLRLSSKYEALYSSYCSVKYRVHRQNATRKLVSDIGLNSTFNLLLKHVNLDNGKYKKIIKNKLDLILLEMYNLKSLFLKTSLKKYRADFPGQTLMLLSVYSGVNIMRIVNRIQRMIK